MNEDFTPFELAVKLKEKGFDIPFYFYYRTDDKLIHHAMVTKPLVYCDKIDDEVVCAPTISQVLKWLREEKKIYIEIFLYDGKYSCLVKDITQICEDDLFHKVLERYYSGLADEKTLAILGKLDVKFLCGAMAGDIIGSFYEFNATKKYDFYLFTPFSKFTDDTVMTVANGVNQCNERSNSSASITT